MEEGMKQPNKPQHPQNPNPNKWQQQEPPTKPERNPQHPQNPGKKWQGS